MDPNAVFFWLIFVALAFAVGLTIRWLSNALIMRSYSRVAEQFDGVAHDGDGSIRPTICFAHRGCSIVIGSSLRDRSLSREYIYLTAPWGVAIRRRSKKPRFDRSHRNLSMVITKHSIPSSIGEFFGRSDVRIGDDEFDRRYFIGGSDEQAIADILSPPVREAIDALSELGLYREVEISIAETHFSIHKRGRFRSDGSITKFITLSLNVYDLMRSAVDSEVTYLLSPTDDNRATVCPVCAETLAGRIVFCNSCQTPHHRDCWQYNGACATYGCRAKQVAAMRSRISEGPNWR